MVDRHVESGLENKEALIEWSGQTRRSLTYGGLRKRVRSASAYVRQRFGEREQARIAVAGSCTLETVVAWLAIMRAGHVACLVPPREQGHYYRSLWPKLKPADIWSDWTAAKIPGSQPMPVLAEQGDADALSGGGRRPALLLMTSGSTGIPKICAHAHQAFLDFQKYVASSAWLLRPSDVVLGSSGPHFSFGLQAIHAPLMMGGTSVLLPQRQQHAELLDLIEAERVTVFLGVPTLFHMFLSREKRAYEVSSLRLTLAAGEKMPPSVRSAWLAWTRGTILDSIGTTETFLPYLTEYAEDSGAGLGRVDAFSYRFSQYGENSTGDFMVAEVDSESMMLGYLNENGEVQVRDRWFNTNDVFRKSGATHWEFAGRSSDFVKIGGTWVAPQTLEEQLLLLPGVVQAAAVPVTTIEGFTRLRAFVVLKEDGPANAKWTIEGAVAHLKAVLPSWTLRPDRIEVVEALPATPSGKLLRRELYRLLDPLIPEESFERSQKTGASAAR